MLETILNAAGVLLIAGLLAAMVGTIAYGLEPMWRRRKKERIGRREKVLHAAEVHTELIGYTLAKNHWELVGWGAALAFVWWLTDSSGNRGIATFAYLLMVVRHLYRHSAFQADQGFIITLRGLHLFPERQGRPIWKGGRHHFTDWQEIDGYRVDGSLLQFFRGERMAVQVEFDLPEHRRLRELLHDLKIPRMEAFDRVWVAQVDEQALFRLEDEICSLGWELIDLYQEEMQAMGLRPELSVMRNMPGDRLLDEHARSWLQLHLFHAETMERQSVGSYPLWQSSGSVGYLIGLVDQELLDRLNEWIRHVLHDSTPSSKGVVS